MTLPLGPTAFAKLRYMRKESEWRGDYSWLTWLEVRGLKTARVIIKIGNKKEQK